MSRQGILLFALLATASASLRVKVSGGEIEGKLDLIHPSRKFLGVPFAKPPLGDLRWRAPQAVASWSGVRDAKKLPHSCMQPKQSLEWGPTSEDCLYLNVYAPLRDEGAVQAINGTRPVLVWFYGGSWTYGGTSLPLYDGAFDADRLGIIIVTVNYRLGVFGFLGSESLRDAQDSGSTGNYGIMDQRAALQWVRDNIAEFGGDPDRVTIFGQSAGSGSVAAHLTSPRSRGLFHRAIMQSGPFAGWTSREMLRAQFRYDQIALSTGCAAAGSPETTVACLREYNATKLVHAKFDSNGTLDWSPVVDGVDFPAQIEEMAAAGNFTRVPTMLGTVADEGTTFIHLHQDASATDYAAELVKTYGPDFAAKVAFEYPPGNFSSPWQAMVAVWTDAIMACPARRSARWLSEPSDAALVYLYQFTHTPTIVKVSKKLECFHGAEIAFVFDISPLLVGLHEHPLAKAMSRTWAGFAATGDPNYLHALSEEWPMYEPVTDLSAHLDVDQSVVSGLKRDRCDFWDAAFEKGCIPSDCPGVNCKCA